MSSIKGDPLKDGHRVGRRVLVNTGALAGSSLWRIAISFVLQLLIARQLDIAALGIYNAALAYLNVGQIISELGLPSLLVRNLAQSPHHRRALFFMALRMQVVVSLAVWVGLGGFALLLSPASQAALWIGGALLPLYAITSVTRTVFQAAERMEWVLGIESVINMLILAASLLVLFSGGGILYLVGVLVVTQAISAILCLVLLQRSGLLAGSQAPVEISYQELWRQASPFFRLSIADVLLQRLDILLITLLAGEVITGIYSAAYNLVRVLTKLIQSFWQALYPTFSRLHHQTHYKYPLLANLSLRYGTIALLPVVFLSAAVAPELLPFIFSADFIESASVYQSLVWLAPLFFIEAYATTLLMVERRPQASFLVSGIHLIALTILLPLLTLAAQADGAAWASVLAGAIGAVAGIVLLRRYQIPLAFAKFWPLMLAVLLALPAALWLPLAWPLRIVAGGLIYWLVTWLTGIVIAEDIQVFRRSLRGPDVSAPTGPLPAKDGIINKPIAK
jgi:O-antigen/teichoic acid export membrane protein